MVKLKVGKAVVSAIITVVILVIAPYYLFKVYLPSVATINIPASLISQIMVIGIISSVTAFLKALFEKGSRPHGVMNIIFTLWFTYNLYFLLGGGLASPGSFGVVTQSIGYYTLTVDLSFVAYALIGVGLITSFVYLYEAIR